MNYLIVNKSNVQSLINAFACVAEVFSANCLARLITIRAMLEVEPRQVFTFEFDIPNEHLTDGIKDAIEIRDLLSIYSDLHKDVYGFRPRMALNVPKGTLERAIDIFREELKLNDEKALKEETEHNQAITRAMSGVKINSLSMYFKS